MSPICSSISLTSVSRISGSGAPLAVLSSTRRWQSRSAARARCSVAASKVMLDVLSGSCGREARSTFVNEQGALEPALALPVRPSAYGTDLPSRLKFPMAQAPLAVWRWRQSRANPSPRLIPCNRENNSDFLPSGYAVARPRGVFHPRNLLVMLLAPQNERSNNRELILGYQGI